MLSSHLVPLSAESTLHAESAWDAESIEIPPQNSSVGSRSGIEFHFQDQVETPSRRRVAVQWRNPVRRVLLVKKIGNKQVKHTAVDVAVWLASKGITIFVEPDAILDYEGLLGVRALDTSGERLESIDLVISLGGDGTLLHASRLFRFLERCTNKLWPPCLVLGQGSLGFLATVDATDWQGALSRTLCGNVEPVPCTLRTRLRCDLQDADGQSLATWYALNECAVISRSSAIGKLNIFVDGTFVTRVEGDGIIISSPTGSTGYSLSCGGPIVSPSVPCTLLTPIAPASLSFRPVLVSELSVVEVYLPPGARAGEAAVALDGRDMGKLERGGKVVISVARPLPILNVTGLDRDWFEAITTRLKWNARDTEQANLDE